MVAAATVNAADDCPDSSGIARSQCLEKKLRIAEATLAKVEKKAFESIATREYESASFTDQVKSEWRTEEERTQAAWRTYRDAQCRKIMSHQNFDASGSYLTSVTTTCALNKTLARIRELKAGYEIK